MRRIIAWIVPLALLAGTGTLIFWPASPTSSDTPHEGATLLARPPSPTPSAEELRRLARQRAEVQLAWADEQCQRLLVEALEPVGRFFRDAERGVPGFVEDVLGWKSKWFFLLDRLPFAAKGQHEAFLREAFDRHLFTPRQLEDVVRQSGDGLRAGVDGVENQMLVRLRADLDAMQVGDLPAGLDGRDLQRAYADTLGRLQRETQPFVRADLAADLGSLILTDVVVVLGRRLATSGGLLTAGTAGSWGSFGATLVAGIVVDQVLGWVWDRLADPRGRLEEALRARFAYASRCLLDGDGTMPGLRHRLEAWIAQRNQARRAAVLQLLEKGGGQ